MNKISRSEAGLLLDKLIRENIPVVAFFIKDGVQVKLRGFVSKITASVGLEIIARQDSTSTGYLIVPIGEPVGSGCVFAYGDKRELPERTREELAERLGEAVLIIATPGGGQLRLFFTS